MRNEELFSALPLRQRKQARTKLLLLDAAVRALKGRELEAVTVRELCDAVSISEPGFFNYFPRKADLLIYYVQLWSLEMGWHAARLAGSRGGLAAIAEIYALTGRKVAEHPGVMAEIVAAQARMTEPPLFAEVSLAERLLAFPELDGIEAVVGVGLDELLPPLLERAVAGGELPRSTDLDGALLAHASIFFGVPVVFRRHDAAGVARAYQTQLELLWAGLRAQEPR